MSKIIKNGLMNIMIIAVVLAMVLPVSAQTDEFTVVMTAAIAANGEAPGGQMKAVDLKTAVDANDATTPLVLDVRPYSEYVAGHVPGAINIYYRDLGKAGALNYLNTALAANVAAGKKNEIVVYGNTHHLSIMVASYLYAAQGYPAKALQWGFAAWTKNETVAPGRFKDCDNTTTPNQGCTSNNFPTTTLNTIDAATQSGNGYPVIDYISGTATSADLAEITRNTYDARFGDPSKPDYRITAAEVYALLNDGDASNDPYVLSNRGTKWVSGCPNGPYYTAGHITSAVAVNWCPPGSTATPPIRLELQVLDATDFLPTDRLIVHHCWIGVSQQYGGLWYNLLGYNVVSMDYGMNGWTQDATVRDFVITPARIAAWYPNDFAFDTGPGTAYGTYSIPLQAGWNLISLPLVPDDTTLTTVLASIDGNYSVVYALIGGNWKKSTARGTLKLTDMTVDYGYSIYMTADDTLELSGTVPTQTTFNVITGWNQVGYPSDTTRVLTDVLSSIDGNYSVVYALIDGGWKKSTARGALKLSDMAPGYGYRIYATADGSYVVDY